MIWYWGYTSNIPSFVCFTELYDSLKFKWKNEKPDFVLYVVEIVHQMSPWRLHFSWAKCVLIIFSKFPLRKEHLRSTSKPTKKINSNIPSLYLYDFSFHGIVFNQSSYFLKWNSRFLQNTYYRWKYVSLPFITLPFYDKQYFNIFEFCYSWCWSE